MAQSIGGCFTSSAPLRKRPPPKLNLPSPNGDDNDEVVKDGPKRKIVKEQSKRPAQSYSPPEPIGGNILQFHDYRHPVTRARLKPFTNSGEPHELAGAGFYTMAHCDIMKCHSCNVVVQNWEKNDNVICEHCQLSVTCSVGSNQLCIATPESSRLQSNCQRDVLDGCSSSGCFKSPTQSRSGSPNAAQSSEQFTVSDILRTL